MMRKLYVALLACISISIALITAAVASSHWIQICINLKESLESVTVSDGVTADLQFLSYFDGIKGCINFGLFGIQIETASKINTKTVTTPLPKNESDFVEVTAALFLLSLVLLIVGFGFTFRLIKDLANDPDEPIYDSSKLSLIAIFVAGLLLTGGMIAFTVQQSDAVYEPYVFNARYEPAVAKLFSSLFSLAPKSQNKGYRPPVDGANHPRPKGQSVLEVGPAVVDQSISDDFRNSSFSSSVIYGSYFNLRLKPVFGWSYYLGWVVVICAIVSACFSFAVFLKTKKVINVSKTSSNTESQKSSVI